MPRKKNVECREEQLSKLKPDIQFLKDQFNSHTLCPYQKSPHSQLPVILVALKYVKLQQRKKTTEKEVTLDS
jgi:hypothetical protein